MNYGLRLEKERYFKIRDTFCDTGKVSDQDASWLVEMHDNLQKRILYFKSKLERDKP